MSLIPQVNTITINTDASFSPQTNIGGYAFYIVCDHFKVRKSGKFKNKPKNSLDAEIMAIGNAFHHLLNRNDLPKTKWLIVNTDCTYAINSIRNSIPGRSKEVFILWQKLISKVESKKNKFRHVKAHSGKDDARSYVNEWCDKEAKKHMREAVNMHNKLQQNE